MGVSTSLPLKDLAELSQLSPSKIHSYLVSFIEIGLVVQNPNTNQYSLGPYALQLGLGYLDQVSLFSTAKPIMEKLSLEIGQTVFLGVWGNAGPTIVYRVDSSHSTAVLELRIGSVLPVLNSALGLNFAANLGSHHTQKYFDRELKTTKEIGSKKQLQQLLALVKQQGISKSSGQLLRDYTAISVPVFDFTGTMIAGITIMGKIGELDDDLDSKTAAVLKRYGLAISEGRGYKKELSEKSVLDAGL